MIQNAMKLMFGQKDGYIEQPFIREGQMEEMDAIMFYKMPLNLQEGRY